MKQTAEDYLGEEVVDAIVTVPAHFNDAQRQATKDAGRIAGLNVIRIINEPTAAALAYGMQQKKDGIYAVYDLGGGTFDVTVLQMTSGVFEVRATSGDTFLGGEDFDRRLVDKLADEFEQANGVDLRDDRMSLQRLKEAAEKAKHELSSATTTDISLPFIRSSESGPLHLSRTITRSELEELVDDLANRTLVPCRDALKAAGLKTADIAEVILVGGMTRMPLIQQKVAEFFGRQPNKDVNPDEVVAIGAATQGGVLRGEVADVLLLDVTPLTLGVETQGGVFTPLIPRNTTIPVTVSEIFTTAVDNQPFVGVHALQGERPLARDNTSLARFELTGIPPAPRGMPQIEVSFHIDANGLVEVAARDLGTGRAQAVQVNAASGLGEADIERIIEEAEVFRNQDELNRELAEFRNRAEGLMYTSERSLSEYGNVLSAADQEAVRAALSYCRQVLDRDGGIDEVRGALSALEDAAYRLADAMYAHLGQAKS
jgi:molecular chaperone DnaK